MSVQSNLQRLLPVWRVWTPGKGRHDGEDHEELVASSYWHGNCRRGHSVTSWVTVRVRWSLSVATLLLMDRLRLRYRFFFSFDSVALPTILSRNVSWEVVSGRMRQKSVRIRNQLTAGDEMKGIISFNISIASCWGDLQKPMTNFREDCWKDSPGH